MRYNLILEFDHICTNIKSYDLYNIVINKYNRVFILVDDTIHKIDIEKKINDKQK